MHGMEHFLKKRGPQRKGIGRQTDRQTKRQTDRRLGKKRESEKLESEVATQKLKLVQSRK